MSDEQDAQGAAGFGEGEEPDEMLKRLRARYQAQGYSREWVTARFMRAVYGKNESAYAANKELSSVEELRDHMDMLELSLISLAESYAATLHQERNSQGFDELARDAREAGEVAGAVRRLLEERLGRPIVSGSNFLNEDRP